jgi:hypothetical protein
LRRRLLKGATGSSVRDLCTVLSGGGFRCVPARPRFRLRELLAKADRHRAWRSSAALLVLLSPELFLPPRFRRHAAIAAPGREMCLLGWHEGHFGGALRLLGPPIALVDQAGGHDRNPPVASSTQVRMCRTSRLAKNLVSRLRCKPRSKRRRWLRTIRSCPFESSRRADLLSVGEVARQGGCAL